MTSVMPRGLSFMQKVKFQWKRGWNEIPEVMVSVGMMAFGVTGVAITTYVWGLEENKTRQFKPYYSIFRSTDPEVALIKRNDQSPPITKTPTSTNFKLC